MPKAAALLISVIILGAIFLSFAVVGIQGVLRESNSLITLTYKKTADALAGACVDAALYRLGLSESYAGNETITINDKQCSIRPIQYNGSLWTIETEASVQGRTSRLRTVLSARWPLVIVSSNQVSTF